eukprot:gnl/Hemi2/26710_TR8978_c0_g1_i1.p1 gnl/Hemi2/26710_TR8978_c0_g1~~gnl/Hemi2/26710_TR8978_c0_g1_i1.p1  ORF type:complete len:525 (+),score=63.01 gnl/Hemi2/26710_TR8978_c0_g1_i1:67-1641(+)
MLSPAVCRGVWRGFFPVFSFHSGGLCSGRLLSTTATGPKSADPRRLTIVEAAAGLQSGALTAEGLVEEHLAAISSSPLNAFISVLAGQAREEARLSDARRREGKSLGPLDGIPLAAKDNFCSGRTTAGSRMLHNFDSPYESTVTQRLKSAGAIFLGKTNMDEFGMGSANLNSHFGPVTNPHSPAEKLVAGGSSGGSAAAVADFLCMGALGSDTGGSVRQPASHCGVIGFKPTYGSVSRHGLISYASSFDTPGVLTRSVPDAALLLDAIVGPDFLDSTCIDDPSPRRKDKSKSFSQSLASSPSSLAGLTVGIPREYHVAELPEEVLALWAKGIDVLEQAGATVVSISLPHTQHALPTYYILVPAEASSNLSRYDGVRYGYHAHRATYEDSVIASRTEGFGEEVKRRLLIGTYVLSASAYESYYKQAQKVRSLVSGDFVTAFQKVDLVLTPTSPFPAFPINSPPSFLESYTADIFTIPPSLAGLPAISFPAGLVQNWPMGLQLVGRRWDERRLLHAANVMTSFLTA